MLVSSRVEGLQISSLNHSFGDLFKNIYLYITLELVKCSCTKQESGSLNSTLGKAVTETVAFDRSWLGDLSEDLLLQVWSEAPQHRQPLVAC